MKTAPNKPIGDDISVSTERLTTHLYNVVYYYSVGYSELQSPHKQNNRLSRALDELKRPIINEIYKETTWKLRNRRYNQVILE